MGTFSFFVHLFGTLLLGAGLACAASNAGILFLVYGPTSYTCNGTIIAPPIFVVDGVCTDSLTSAGYMKLVDNDGSGTVTAKFCGSDSTCTTCFTTSTNYYSACLSLPETSNYYSFYPIALANGTLSFFSNSACTQPLSGGSSVAAFQPNTCIEQPLAFNNLVGIDGYSFTGLIKPLPGTTIFYFAILATCNSTCQYESCQYSTINDINTCIFVNSSVWSFYYQVNYPGIPVNPPTSTPTPAPTTTLAPTTTPAPTKTPAATTTLAPTTTPVPTTTPSPTTPAPTTPEPTSPNAPGSTSTPTPTHNAVATMSVPISVLMTACLVALLGVLF